MNNIIVLVVEPNNEPETREVSNDLESLQQIVGGYLDSKPAGGDVYLLYQEPEIGDASHLPANAEFEFKSIYGTFKDEIRGTFFFAKVNLKGDFVSLTGDDITWLQHIMKSVTRL